MHIKLQQMFNCNIRVGSGISIEVQMEKIIQELKDCFGVSANKNELLTFINKRLVMNENYEQEYQYVVNIKPTESLLRKFEKDYPELVI